MTQSRVKCTNHDLKLYLDGQKNIYLNETGLDWPSKGKEKQRENWENVASPRFSFSKMLFRAFIVTQNLWVILM